MFCDQLTTMDKKIMSAALFHFTENIFDDIDLHLKTRYDEYAKSMLDRLTQDTSDYLHNEVNVTALALTYFIEAAKFNLIPRSIIKEFPSKSFLIRAASQLESNLCDAVGLSDKPTR